MSQGELDIVAVKQREVPIAERRRKGRKVFDNPHLVHLLRAPNVTDAPAWEDAGAETSNRPWFPIAVLAALALWSVIVRLAGLLF